MTDWETGILAFREGRLREAADRLHLAAEERERAVTQEARYQTLAFLGAALYALGRAGDATGAFEQALRLCPAPVIPPDLTVNLANSYLATGRRDDARRTLDETLDHSPGHVEARMLRDRLDSHEPGAPLSGSVLGESPDAARQFLRTLTFGTVAQGGYAPDQVREALAMISHYVEFLASQVDARDQTVAQQAAQLEQARQTENALIDNLVQARQDADRLRNAAVTTLSHSPAGDESPDPAEESLTPLAKLFQKKS